MPSTKTIISLVLISSLVLLPSLTLAQDTFGTGYLTGATLPDTDVREVVINLVNTILGILALITLVGILYGGFMIMTAGGDSNRRAKGGKTVSNFVIGLLIIFLAFAITQFVFNVLTEAT